MVIKKTFFLFIFSFFFILGCTPSEEDNNNKNNTDPELAKIKFINHSSYSIDIYLNYNPENFDPTTLICTVNSGSEKEEFLPTSRDQFLGDIFYLRFKVQVADSTQTGTGEPLFFPAERNMSNITLVLESGKSYSKVIDNPPANELRFINGLIEVHNHLNEHIWIENNSTILPQLCRDSPWLTLGQFGYYEITLPFMADSWTMDNIKSRDSLSNRTPFPSFVMERGKIYSFQITNEGIKDAGVRNINPLAK